MRKGTWGDRWSNLLSIFWKFRAKRADRNRQRGKADRLAKRAQSAMGADPQAPFPQKYRGPAAPPRHDLMDK